MSDLNNLWAYLPQTKTEAVADVIGASAITSGWWLPYLKAASEEANLLLPLAGLFLVIVNVVARILITRSTLKRSRE